MANRLQQISSQLVAPPRVPTSDEIQYMCRICSNCEVSINVFSELGKLLNLEQKIKTCFKLELNESGPFPNNVCMNCLGKVNISYEHHLLVAATQEKLTTALTRAGVPNNRNMYQPSAVMNGSSSALKYSPVIESVQSLVPNPYMNDVKPVPTPVPPVPTEAPKPPLLAAVKRSASPDDAPKKERKTVCSTCGEWFFKSELAAHTKQVHQSVTLVYGCVNCSSNFTTQEELAKHSEVCS
uniref:ZAD domain-containing protein n=1 Tax=Lygus hesperus TaxID=30085 RepID=A0A0A9WRW6_LYGHE